MTASPGGNKSIGFATAECFYNEGDVPPVDSPPRGIQATPQEIADGIHFLTRGRNIVDEILVSDGGERLS